ncbi:MAG TPA: NYN domain-containing protein [Candidatus Deferrimicrobium sp.]|nr:NYN domain-containing protein [Candidatus Deferrimicrobium sp.]
MAKIMLFIDGSWLYANMSKLGESYGQEDFHIDFGKLPQVLAQQVGRQLGMTDVDVVRTYLFGSYPDNYDLRDEDTVERRKDFFSRLKEEYHYELETFPINYRGRRLRRDDRDPGDRFEPKEKCVDVALATSLLYFAAIPYAYDIAIAVLGDRDYKPVLQAVRRLGKRVAIASIKGSCPVEFADQSDEARVKDFDIIWLSDLLAELELKYERHQLDCHSCHKKVWTTFHPRKGQRFFCDQCRTEFEQQKQQAQQDLVSSEDEFGAVDSGADSMLGETVAGRIKRVVSDKGFGFIQAAGRDYFFHITDLVGDLRFEEIREQLEVEFEIKKTPSRDKAGAAQNVRRLVRVLEPEA